MNTNETNNSNNSSFRDKDDYGKHPSDFKHDCCFRHQILRIGRGIKYGNGELVDVEMQSGKTAIYQLYAGRYNYIFDDTGQKNWRFLFIKYK